MPVVKQTPSQTVGPFFAFGLTPEQYGYTFASIAAANIAADADEGHRVVIEGRVLDGDGAAVADAMVEFWQADAMGRYAHPRDPRGSNASFRGFARVGTGTDPDRRFVLRTIKPGAVDAVQAPHISVHVLMRGMLVHAHTRIYFSDEAAANDKDPVLGSVPPERRETLIARLHPAAGTPVYRFDIHMQGDRETVFFDA